VVERLPQKDVKTVLVRLVESDQVLEVELARLHWGQTRSHHDQRGIVPRLLDWLFSVLHHGTYQQPRVKVGYMQVITIWLFQESLLRCTMEKFKIYWLQILWILKLSVIPRVCLRSLYQVKPR